MKTAKFTSISALSLLFLCVFSLPPIANAQAVDQSQAMERMDHIERDLMLLHRQLARGEATGTTAGEEGGATGGTQLEIRLSAIEEQLRDLRGKIEENENHVRKVSETLEKFQKDTEFRFNDMAKTQSAAPSPNQLPTSGKLDFKPTNTSQEKVIPPEKAPASDKSSGSSSGAGTSEPTTFASPREHYNYAFRLLNQTQYEESANAFESFTKKYPKDPLVGNAYYWEGETFYIRRDYVNAADNFRKGFEALPEGPKAADNLLKLAMSLNAINRDKDACLVLQQIGSKFKKSASSVADKAEQEQKRIGCGKS